MCFGLSNVDQMKLDVEFTTAGRERPWQPYTFWTHPRLLTHKITTPLVQQEKFLHCWLYGIFTFQFMHFSVQERMFHSPTWSTFMVLPSLYSLVIMTMNNFTPFRSVSLCPWETLVWELRDHVLGAWYEPATCLNPRATGATNILEEAAGQSSIALWTESYLNRLDRP